MLRVNLFRGYLISSLADFFRICFHLCDSESTKSSHNNGHGHGKSLKMKTLLLIMNNLYYNFDHSLFRKSRKKSKQKKSDGDSPQDSMQARNLPNITYSGELFQKWKLGKWMKRYCVIFKDNTFCVYKNDKETKAIHSTGNYDAIYLEKEGKRNHVIRLSHPTMETLWFSAESKSLTDYWLVVSYNIILLLLFLFFLFFLK